MTTTPSPERPSFELPFKERFKDNDLWRAKFLDLVHGDSEIDPTVSQERRGGLFLQPHEVQMMVVRTRLGEKLLIPAGEQITRFSINGLYAHNQLGAPVATDSPTRAYWRSEVGAGNPDDPDAWFRTLGIVLEFDSPSETSGGAEGVITGVQEVGLLMVAPGELCGYRRTKIDVDGRTIAAEQAETLSMRPQRANEAVSNLSALLATRDLTAYPLDMHGIDLTAFETKFGDQIEIQ